MAKKKKSLEIDPEASKSTIEGFRGGMRLPLDRIMEKGTKLRTVLEIHIKEIFDKEKSNQRTLEDNLTKWQKIYFGQKEPKTWPFPNCFSRDTEILTSNGWWPVDEVRPLQKVLSLNPKTKESSFQRIKKTISRFEEKLINLKSNSIDLLVTEDHNILAYSQECEKPKFIKAKDVRGGWKIPLVSKFIDGINPDDIDGYNPEKIVQFIGWYIAEGWTYKHGTIGIAQSEINQEKRDKIENLLLSLDFKFKKKKWGFLVSCKKITPYLRACLRSLGHSHEKHIPPFIKQLNPRLLSLLLNAMVAGDGHIRKDGETTYYTTSKKLADDVQEISQKIGLRARITIRDDCGREIYTHHKYVTPGITRHLGYCVSILKRSFAKTRNLSKTIVDYNDFVYCFTTEPFHTVYVRRNGIACWSGQCSNVAVPITRSAVDTVFVRIVDAIFNKMNVWIVKARKAEFIDLAKEVEDGLDWFQRNILHLKRKLLSPLMQGLKTGTGIGELVYEEKRRTVYRYATPEEEKDPAIHKYPLPKTNTKGIKYVQQLYAGPNFYPVSREDFILSSDATEIEDAYLVGNRFYLRKTQLESRVRQDLYDKEPVEKITAPDQYSDQRKGRATIDKKELDTVPYTDPYELWKLWLRYDVDEDGEEDDIMVVYHPSSGQILRGIYAPLFSGMRPYTKFIFYPKEFSFDGEGIVQILEHLQVTLDTLVNQMIDRVTQINAPILFTREGCGLDGVKSLTPGRVYPLADTPKDAIQEFRFSDVTISLSNEIQWIVSMMDRAVGVTPISLGISTAERPVAKDTFAQQEETNKKFAFGTDNLRDCITELGYKILEFIAQYQPNFEYHKAGDKGMPETRTVQFPVEYIRDAFEIELAASSELLNKEVRREIFMQVYQLLSDFMTKIGGMAQMITSPQVPSDFKKVLIDGSNKSVLILNKILENFPDMKDSKNLIMDITEAIDTEKMIQQSADIIAEKQQKAQAQAQQQGQGPPQPEQIPQNAPLASAEQMLMPQGQ